MIIGVDAGALSITDDRLKVGVWRVADNLIRELLKQDKKNIYRLYSFRPLSIGGQNVVLPRKGFFRFFLPLELLRHPPDVFLGLSQALPSFTPKNSIGFVYDLGFLHAPTAYPDSYTTLKKQTEDLVTRANRIVTISHTSAQDLINTYGVDKNQLTVSYPGVSSQFRATGKKHKSSQPYFLFVGALKRGKNIPALLEAFATYNGKSKEIHDLYLVGGNYWLDPDIEEAVDRLSLRNRVRLLGVVSDEKLASFYRGAVGLVVPSLWEGFCLPVVEAMASGCPVIVSNTGALPEIAGNAGILVDPMNSNEIASAMQNIKPNGKGITRAKQFSWQRMAQTVLKLIK